MERYFIGNNTGLGFYSNYEHELKDMNKVILLKGGPGTGKSSIIKRIASMAKSKGYDYEIWYCSGDPQSLDGVYIKDINVAVVDATSPHAIGADLPILKDKIYDLATSLKYEKLKAYEKQIKKLANDKKQCFARAYQHLKCAFGHLSAQLEIEDKWLDKAGIRARAIATYDTLRQKCRDGVKGRRVFARAICPCCESEYFDHLWDKRIIKIDGSKRARQIFFDELKNLDIGDMYILNPLNPEIVDGIVSRDVVLVHDIGHFDRGKCDVIDLNAYEKRTDVDDVEDEKNNVLLQTAFAVECLNRARLKHLEMEKYYVAAMDFNNNERIYDEIVKDIFGA